MQLLTGHPRTLIFCFVLNPTAYRETLKAAVAEYRTRAIQFKAAGRADDVKLLLARMKMMESEIAQVDQMEAEAASEGA